MDEDYVKCLKFIKPRNNQPGFADVIDVPSGIYSENRYALISGVWNKFFACSNTHRGTLTEKQLLDEIIYPCFTSGVHLQNMVVPITRHGIPEYEVKEGVDILYLRPSDLMIFRNLESFVNTWSVPFNWWFEINRLESKLKEISEINTSGKTKYYMSALEIYKEKIKCLAELLRVQANDQRLFDVIIKNDEMNSLSELSGGIVEHEKPVDTRE
jgi:hypothetical protein